MTERCTRCLKRLETAVNASGPLVERVALLHHRASGIWILPGVVWGRDVVPDLREAEALPLLRVLEALARLRPARIVPEQGDADDGALLDAYWTRLLNAQRAWQQIENDGFENQAPH